MFTSRNYSFDNDFPKEFAALKNKEIDDWEIPPWDLLIDQNKLIGKGEFGHVYLAKWRSTQVVAKIMNEDIRNDQKELFLNEFDNLSKSHHPNIVQIFGYVKEPFIIVMEYLSQDNLLYHTYKNRLSLLTKIDVCLDILKGLEYLHSRRPQSIIHRDLKPQNIILNSSMTAKIGDFGLSKLLKSNDINYNLENSKVSVLSKSNNFLNEDLTLCVGTKRYMSPEISKQLKYNHKIDIWSAGIIFLELFENRRYNSNFYWIKTPKKIKNIINQSMLIEEPENRLDAKEIILLFEQIKSKYTNKYWYNLYHKKSKRNLV